MKRILKPFLKNQTGVAALEFIIVFPFLFALLFGGLEIARYIVIIQKVDNAAYAVTDAVAQMYSPEIPSVPNEVTAARVDDAMKGLGEIMGTYHDPAKETVVVSSVHRGNSGRVLRWQRSTPNALGISSVVTGGSPTNTLRRGPAGCAAAPLAEYATQAAGMYFDENMIVGEVYYRYTPIWSTLLGNVAGATPDPSDGFSLSPQTIRRVIFMHTRNGPLVDLPNPPSQPLVEAQSDC